MLTLQIKEKEIENLTPEEKFIRGTVGAKCQINFDEFWQYYKKYVVFKRVGYEPINIMVDSLENEIEIPYTILAESGEFKIGVFGTTETETLPTLYSKDIKIRYGTDTHGTTPPTYIPSEIDQLRLSKQDKLVSGENIKTVNGNSILGSGNITIEGGSGSSITVDQTFNPESENAQSGKAVAEAVAPKADKTYVNDIVNELNNRFPSIKTVMDEVAVASTQYYLGEVTELNITLPEDTEIGQEITVSWYNGETDSTLAIDGNMLDFDYTPEANTRSEINALWDGTYWSVIGMSQEVPSEVTV